MAIIAEVTIAPEAFPLGRVSLAEPSVRVELERVVPTTDVTLPFIWVTGANLDAFERSVESLEEVDELTELARFDRSALYQVQWGPSVESFVTALAERGATVLTAEADGEWQFKLRFANHADLSQFSEWCRDNDYTIGLRRLHSLADATDSRSELGLTGEQHEALTLATTLGYFKVPKRATLADLAAELDISEQAAGERVRRAMDRLANAVVLTDESPVQSTTPR
ncbi:bacterio-opsin activator domain-containing protein [Haloarchaeobius sp. DFWS5]|uniref:helix-turn-helix domain-containing protein n=1 Tax=Haloarchaeobius sp. DFWS5 TaxID=3446114 RepID=UPI003EBB0E72